VITGRSVTGPAAATPRRRLGFGRLLLLIVLRGARPPRGLRAHRHQFDHHRYDAVFYEREARSLADGHGFVNPRPGPNQGETAADHPPLTALVPAVFYGTARFRVPAEPTVVVLATVGASVLAARRWPGVRPDVPGGAAPPDETGRSPAGW
jgi:hypothetical protein